MKLWIWILLAAVVGGLITWFVMNNSTKTKLVNAVTGATA